MGAIVILRREQAKSGPLRQQALARCLLSQGFGSPTIIETDHWTILAAGKYAGQGPAIHIQDAQNFAICSGTFIYRGKVGVDAAKLFFAEADGSTVPWDVIYGSFCVTVCRNGVSDVVRDRLGTYKLYRDRDWTIVSSSFLAVLETVGRATADPQSIYEYVFQGATYDDRTVVDQVRLVEGRTILQLDSEVHRRKIPDGLWEGPKWSSFDDHLAMTGEALQRQFTAIVNCFGNNIDTALSGGYDSRLLLALLREQGVAPRVHVYGREDDPDVLVARSIARGEGFAIAHVDKSEQVLPSLEEFPAVVLRNFLSFDGYPADGIFDNGADAATRSERARGAGLALNGGGGEIFRNFFYLADRSFTVHQLLGAFFSQFDPGICTSRFRERDYLVNLACAVGHLLDFPVSVDRPEKVRLTRKEIEHLYPSLRCVYWMGRNNSVNNRFGYFATPFVEPALVKLALQIPISCKNHGLFEAALITAADPALAKYPSVYGQAFTDTPRFKRLWKDYLTLMRPIFVRKNSYRMRNRFRHRRAIPRVLANDYIATVLDPALPHVRRYFNISNLTSSSELNRICTLEYLFQKYKVSRE